LIGLSFAPHSNVGDIRSLGLGFLKSPRRLSSGLGNQARGLDLWGIGEQRGRCVLVRSLRSRRSERGQNGFRMPHSLLPYPHPGNRREEGVAPKSGKRESTASAIRKDLRDQTLTATALRDMPEKELAARYGVSRDTARKARHDVLRS
jgi:hypothetical protein